MKKNDIFKGVCTDYTEEGLGVVRHEDFVYFVKGILKGEEAEIRIISLKKNYGYGKVEKILLPSPHRREAECPYYPKCGGCQLMHMDYAEQASFKEEKVRQAFARIAKLDVTVEPILKADAEFHYRNKVQIPLQFLDGKLLGGFYRGYSHDIVPIDGCLLQSEEGNRVYREAKELIEKYHYEKEIRHILIKHAFATQEVMLVLISRSDKLKNIHAYAGEIMEQDPHITTVILNLNQRDDNVILGEKNTVIEGSGYIMDILLNKKFKISANSFYQINPAQTERLYQTAIKFAQLSGEENTADVYGGIGTIGICASDKAKRVYGVEWVAEAVRDAKENSRINHLEHTYYEIGDAGKAVERWLKEGVKIDVAFIDPPRKGCDELTISSLVKLNPERIVYVSCNPATLARDAKRFSELGYVTERVQPVDMFPNTNHIETIVLLQKLNS